MPDDQLNKLSINRLAKRNAENLAWAKHRGLASDTPTSAPAIEPVAAVAIVPIVETRQPAPLLFPVVEPVTLSRDDANSIDRGDINAGLAKLTRAFEVVKLFQSGGSFSRRGLATVREAVDEARAILRRLHGMLE